MGFNRLEGTSSSGAPKICEKCGGALYATRRCPWVVMRCRRCGASLELREIVEQIDDPFEEDLGWIPMDRL
jgi:ribosomal protein L40E